MAFVGVAGAGAGAALSASQVAAGEAREYGHSMVSRIAANKEAGEALLGKLPDTTKMWMSHGDKLTAVPEVRQTVPFFGDAVRDTLYPFPRPRQ